ncbi:MAG: hypothetical protein JXX29_13880 [Deltaproteobacteria bacterium]|nr:hypothetical protein [Deltaproteobacteria bacterium]MBN2672766.1 hypothetical protein [Deltaproteobacteria bacterium]
MSTGRTQQQNENSKQRHRRATLWFVLLSAALFVVLPAAETFLEAYSIASGHSHDHSHGSGSMHTHSESGPYSQSNTEESHCPCLCCPGHIVALECPVEVPTCTAAVFLSELNVFNLNTHPRAGVHRTLLRPPQPASLV